MLLVLALVCAMIISLAASMLVPPGQEKAGSPADATPVHARAYVSHAPIVVDNDSGLATQGWPGSGTSPDPYVISGFEIDGSGHESGIFIGNTTVVLIVSDNLVYGSSKGICLLNVTGALIRNNSCTQCMHGIYLELSDGNNISDNSCYLNSGGVGIGLYSSSDNLLLNNACTQNLWGISLVGSNSNPIAFNNCSSSEPMARGITIDTSNNCTVAYNDCSGNAYQGIRLINECHNDTVTDNLCTHCGDGIDLSMGPTDCTVAGNDCSWSNITGIYLYQADRNLVDNNTCSSNDVDGIMVRESDLNRISSNMIADNGRYGMDLAAWGGSTSDYNTIWNNSLIRNNGSGAVYNASHVQAIDDGVSNEWSNGGYGNYWEDWLAPDVLPPTGTVDLPYNISGSAGAQDSSPMTTSTAIPEFGGMFLLVLLSMMVFVGSIARSRRP